MKTDAAAWSRRKSSDDIPQTIVQTGDSVLISLQITSLVMQYGMSNTELDASKMSGMVAQ